MPCITDIPVLKILIIDDHLIFAQGLRELLLNIHPLVEIKETNNTEKALSTLIADEYHFLFSDVMIPGEDVSQFISECKKKFPLLNILMISSVIDIPRIKEFIALGINGYISKAVTFNELKEAIIKVYNGENYISSDISHKLANTLFFTEKHTLTKKETEILKLVAAGHTVDAASKLLHLSPYTILAHRRSIMKKLDLHSAAELVKYAFENNLQ